MKRTGLDLGQIRQVGAEALATGLTTPGTPHVKVAAGMVAAAARTAQLVAQGKGEADPSAPTHAADLGLQKSAPTTTGTGSRRGPTHIRAALLAGRGFQG